MSAHDGSESCRVWSTAIARSRTVSWSRASWPTSLPLALHLSSCRPFSPAPHPPMALDPPCRIQGRWGTRLQRGWGGW
eukprot:9867537-Alexandrium_andersonii.AAC.1